MIIRVVLTLFLTFVCFSRSGPAQQIPDFIRDMQLQAIETDAASWGYWGLDPSKYTGWVNHSNRLIPIYVYGGSLEPFKGARSLYRDEERIRDVYSVVPEGTFNPKANYIDQTDLYQLQVDAVKAGKKNIILLIFDGMDWQTTQAAAIYKQQRIVYHEGRGCGLSFIDYQGAPTDYGFCVTSSLFGDAKPDVNRQQFKEFPLEIAGGYVAALGGSTPWQTPASPAYLIGTHPEIKHVVTDSASSATSITCGVKTYNSAINVNFQGKQVEPIARQLQRAGFGIGVVTSVPISHATPACAYANNLDRDDYQDLTRDMIGLPSISHPQTPLTGVDVLIGGGWGEVKEDDRTLQGQNYVPGNKFFTAADHDAVNHLNGGKYVIAERTASKKGCNVLRYAALNAAKRQLRLLGYFGQAGGHLPYRTADGNYDPTRGQMYYDRYSPEAISENPTLAEMTEAALTVLESKNDSKGIWLMVEAGDVDWANHNNNLDDSIGAVFSGEEAFDVIVKWIEKNQCWDDTLLIVTADHGHYFNLVLPEALIRPREESANKR